MHLKLRDQQLKPIMYIYRQLYQNLMVTVKQNTDIHTNKKKDSKHKIKNSHQITREENKRVKAEKQTYKNKFKTVNKMAVRTYISIITLNVSGLNAPTKRQTG